MNPGSRCPLMVKIEHQPVTFFRTIPHSQVPLLLISHLGETGSKQTSGVDNKQQKVATKHHRINNKTKESRQVREMIPINSL